ncbi:MAG: cupin superfamily protein [Betaproteobacteria bacterium]|nr:cupin superfamily protein [Betaproteobacteria bacterium]
MSTDGIKPIRRVVTGLNAQGKSCVLYDSAAPGVKASAFKKGTGMTDIWLWNESPAPIDGNRDDGDVPFHFEPPETGGRLRVVQSECKPKDYDASKDTYITAEHAPRRTEGGTWERGRQSLFQTRIHKSETLDYGVMLSGERVLVTDESEHVLTPGDVVIQVGSWHAWSDRNFGSQMAFVMMAAELEDQK